MKLYKVYAALLLILLMFPQVYSSDAEAYSDHPNLFVSAENSMFENHFSGAMVIEVIVKEKNSQLDQAIGEPNVRVNGRQLRMVQGTDGNWYAFFANAGAARQADQISLRGDPGQNLDFGVFCSGSTSPSVLGASFSQTDGVAIPDSAGLSGTTQGLAPFGVCSGTPQPPSSQNNVVKLPPSLNTDSHVKPGQIGLDPNVWPLVQLFSFSGDVSIEYNAATGTQSVNLTYSDIPNISVKLDRSAYPAGSEVFATINDIQLDEDPTTADSWTFNVANPYATFYQAFPEYGGGNTAGLVNILPSLTTLGFKDNGKVEMVLGNIVTLKTNNLQTTSSINVKGTNYNNLVTFVETGTNSGVFKSDYSSVSTIGILPSAPRGQSGSIEYNLHSTSIVSGTSPAGLAVGAGGGQFGPGQRENITLVDKSQVLNSGVIESLDVYRSSTKIPTLKIGNPTTLGTASDVKFYSTPNSLLNPISIPSSIPDTTSARLVLDTRSLPPTNFYEVTINLGITTQRLKDLFVDAGMPGYAGTDWINYDIRSFQQLGIASFSDASMTLHFGGPSSSSSVQIASAGTLSSGNGLIQIANSAISSIESQSSSSPVYLELNFGSSPGTISNESDTQPIVFDLFSFGQHNGQYVNNAIYRAELQETSPGSGVFKGTMEYVMINQLNQFDPSLISSLRTFGSDIRFLVTGQMVDEKGINFSISSSPAGRESLVTSKNALPTTTGVVTLDSSNYRIGSPVTITLYDKDLVGDPDTIQSFTTVNDPNSPAVDTVGDKSGNILLEVWIKGFRFHRCTINGVNYGGLASTGFTLTETGPGTGVFKGTFKLPSTICNHDGTWLISPVGGTVQAWYHDFMDSSGRSVIIGSTVSRAPQSYQSSEQSSTTTPVAPISKVSHTAQVSDSSGRPFLENPKVGQKIAFDDIISNNDVQNNQKISYIIQVKDGQGKVVYLSWVDGTIKPSSKIDKQIKWTPTEPGTYAVGFFVWSGIDSQIPLTEEKEYKIHVVS